MRGLLAIKNVMIILYGSGDIMNKPIVMIVDDDESVCRSLRRLIKSIGYNVRTFTSARNFFESRVSEYAWLFNSGCKDA